MQSYILGLAEVPFRLYMIVSWLCILPWSVAFIVLGPERVFNGNFKLVGTGIGVLIAATRDRPSFTGSASAMPPASIELGSAGPEARPLTVTEFTRRVKAVLERGISSCWVKGEVSNLRVQPSGHVYFSLKDAGAQLSAVMFRAQAARRGVVLRDGLQVVAFGDVGVYEVRGQYQLVTSRTLVDDGVGVLQKAYEALKRRLSDEGLFDPQRKKRIPQMPETVGFLTSPTGAAVQDFVRILIRRGWSGEGLLSCQRKVQGEDAAAPEMVAEMLRVAEKRSGSSM